MPRTRAKVNEAQPDLLGGAPATAKKPTATKSKPKKPDVVVSTKNEVATIQPANPRNMLAVILQAASDPRVDTNKMQAILAMQKEMIAEQARLDFTTAMRGLKRKLPIINKDGRIEFKDKGHGKATLRFASFENLHQVLTPLVDEFGFELWYSSEPGASGMINVIAHVEHENGHSRQTVFPMPHDTSGGKSGAQGWASAFSFGKRTSTIGLFNILTKAPEDRDLDGNTAKRTKGGAPQVIEGDVVVEDGIATVEKITIAQHDKLVDAVEACGVGRKKFCEHYEIKAVADLPVARFDEAMKACADFAKRKAPSNG